MARTSWLAIWLCALSLLLALPTAASAESERRVLPLPYRDQLDGGPYGPANCGPASIGMVLDAHGIDVSSWELRVAAMKLQGTWGAEYRHEWGVFIYNLAQVVEQYGLEVSGLYTREGAKVDDMRRWSLSDLRGQLDRGNLVVVQMEFRAMPGRAGSPYGGDHYVVLHGYAGDDFIYSDPLAENGGGPSRWIGGEALMAAMERSSAPGAAFAVWQLPELIGEDLNQAY